MTRLFAILPAAALCTALTLSASAQHADHAMPGMPAGLHQDWAVQKLEQSPRHREYVTITHDGRTVNALVVYPEVSAKAPVVVLIHEIFGLSDWAKLMADEVASKGYIAIEPDLLTGSGPNGGGTDSLGPQDAVIQAIGKLPPEQVIADLDAVADYGKKLPAANGKLAVAGFCWGGGKSFAFATHRMDLGAAFVFYGPPPPAAQMTSIKAPVYGFYGAMTHASTPPFRRPSRI